jgi:solute carrier family 8 (sodium/calcium exchanger)
VVRVGDTSRKMKISYTTMEDMGAPENKRATEGKDYHKAAGELQFSKGESRKAFEVKMIDDDEVEEDETFLIELSACTDARTEISATRQKTSVTIISDDDPGMLVLAKVPDESAPGEYLDYYTASSKAGTVALLVCREMGSSGAVAVDWRTIAGTAMPGTDYGQRTAPGSPGEEMSGTLQFCSAVSEQHIIIPVLRSGGSASGDFQVELYNPQGGARIGTPEVTQRGASGIITVRVRHDREAERLARDVAKLLDEHYDEIRSGSGSSWGDQFRDAITADDDMGAGEMALFYVNLPWRFIFAFIPPPTMANGWMCFFVALFGIACVTIVVGDLAALLGCSLGLEDSITAITFVALGTSLPDMFASKAATLGDESADSAVGNVTGSNSVNVFLGLGLPWFIAAIYWENEGATELWKGRIGVKNPEIVTANPGGGFAVPAGSLSFSVTVFCSCAVMCILTLYFRRKIFGAELGAREPGSKHQIVTSVFFVTLWCFYIAMSVAQTWGLAADSTLYMIVIGAVVLFAMVMTGLTAKLSGKYITSHSHLGVPFGMDGEAAGQETSEMENPNYSGDGRESPTALDSLPRVSSFEVEGRDA